MNAPSNLFSAALVLPAGRDAFRKLDPRALIRNPVMFVTASVAALLDPELIVLGGGVADAGELLFPSVRAGFERELSARGHRPEARIVAAALGNDAGMVGAADLARVD